MEQLSWILKRLQGELFLWRLTFSSVTTSLNVRLLHLLLHRNYLTTWFLIDFLGTFPFELFVKSDSASSRKSLKLIKYFKIPKLLRISRLMKYIRDHKFVYDVFQVFVLVLTFLHVGACIWMLVISPCIPLTDGNYFDSALCSQKNVKNLYIESFHLSATMLLGVSNSHIIGDSSTLDMLTEKRESYRGIIYTLSTLYMVGGLFLVALLISELNVYVFGKMQGSAAFQRKIDRVKYEMEYYAVPDALQLQVKAFYDYVWIHQKQYDDRIALLSDDQMSTDLQRKLALHLFKDVVSHISIFSEIDDLLLGEICLSLRTRIFLPGDMILFKGDVGRELFIIAKGVVEVLRDDLPLEKRKQNPPIYLQNGSFFGEIALIMETRRTCSVQARTVCEVNILEQRTFDTILRENPNFASRMNELVVARQLERSMSKTASEGVDFEVSKDDMNAAIHAVQTNMEQGLQRRFREETFHSTQSSIASLPADFQDRNGGDQNTDSMRKIEKCLDDITRRSTKFLEQQGPRKRLGTSPLRKKSIHGRVRDRSYSEGNNDDSFTQPLLRSSEVRSENNDYNAELKKSTAVTNKLNPFRIMEGDGEDSETMLITGHYNPNRVKLDDLNKVLPSILNNGDHSDTLSRLEDRILEQEELLTTLISSIETLRQEQTRI